MSVAADIVERMYVWERTQRAKIQANLHRFSKQM